MDEPPVRKHMLDALQGYYNRMVANGGITRYNAAINMDGVSTWNLTDIWRHCKRVGVRPVYER